MEGQPVSPNKKNEESSAATQGNHRRIARNTVMLYIRMFVTMLVGLYTSRVVLSVLGVEDYGIYGVVGGVTAMIGFLNGSMSGATSRFLTFELGRKDFKRLSDTFSNAFEIHIGLSILVLIVAETVGLWFLTHKLVIPPDRMAAAHWVYQFSIINMMLGINQVPYNALVIAHEKMDLYAYVEIVNVVLKLLIVYLLSVASFDKLIFYAFMMDFVSILIMLYYRMYCIRHFKESRFHWVWDKSIFIPMLKYSAWSFYGSMCVAIRQQGTNFLINIFFGVVFNAAASVATTVQGVVKGFTFSSTMAFRPQIVKAYAMGDRKEMISLMESAMTLAVFLSLLISLPLYVEIKYLMDLWLVKAPEMSVEFVRVLIISAFFALSTIIFTIGISATGKNKQANVYTGTIYMLTIPVMYLFFKCGFGVIYSYYCILGANILIYISNMVIFKYLVPEVKLGYFWWLLLKAASVIFISLIPVFFINSHLEEGFMRLVINSLVLLCVYPMVSYWVILDSSSRAVIKKKVFSFLGIGQGASSDKA